MSTVHPPGSRALRVHIVDDNRVVADTLADLLTLSLHVEITTTYSAAEALALAQRDPPDAMVLDLRMPGMSGLELARALRERLPQRPYLIALTGCADEVRDLEAVDAVFDRVLAKPVDTDVLIDMLGRLAAGPAAGGSAGRTIDVAEVVTRVARQVIPLADRRGLSFGFDHQGPSLIADADALALQCGLHRLLLGLFDILRTGHVLLRARTQQLPSGAATLTVDAAATGTLAAPDEIDRVLDRLGLAPQPAGGASALTARGRCRNTGAELAAWIDARNGVLLRVDLALAAAEENTRAHATVPPGTRALLVDERNMPSVLAGRRLQRLGWTVTHVASCTAALEALRDTSAAGPPALLLVADPGLYEVAALAALSRTLPPSTHRVIAATAGSPLLGSGPAVPGFDVRVFPLSPLELADLCRLASDGRDTEPTPMLPADIGLEDLPLVLLVDDNEINLMVGRQLIESLGYRVATAHDGLDAIDQCRHQPPQAVLMDLQMPVLGGLEATARLRMLQRAGEIPPFPILAASSLDPGDVAASMPDTQLDGFLGKPLDVAALRHELRRFTDAAYRVGAARG